MKRAKILSVILFLLFFQFHLSHSNLLGDAPNLSPDEVVAIKAGKIETITNGVIEKGIIIIREGKIAEIGDGLKIPADARIIDASKSTIMPGIVSPNSRLGLSGAGSGNPVSNPHYAVYDELYPFQDVYRQLLRAGVTTLGLVPAGNGIAGQGAIVKPLGDSVQTMLLVKSAFIKINFRANTKTKDVITKAFTSAKKELDAATMKAKKKETGKEEKGKNQKKEPTSPSKRKEEKKKSPSKPSAPHKSNPKIEPLIRALQRKIPVVATCYRPAEVVHFLKLMEQYNLNLVLIVGPNVYRVKGTLAEKKIPVIIKPEITFEPYTRNRMNVPLLLSKAGVKIAFQPIYDSVSGHSALLFKAAELVKYGLSRDVALKALTINPAEMIGVGNRVGSIDVGKDANLIFLSDDPLSLFTRIQKVMIEGKIVYSEERSE